MSNLNQVKIYEFSRGFTVVFSQTHQADVSGGYGKKIDRENHPVPQEIKDEVLDKCFYINDNYPPDEGDYALIARNVAQYSVLAVATRIRDNRERFTVAYRFFWLDRYITLTSGRQTEIDGIGTLISWWHNAGKPKYHLNEAQNQPIDLNQCPVQHFFSNVFIRDYFEPIKHLVANENHISRSYLAQKQADDKVYPSYLEFHSLMNYAQEDIKFKQRYHAPIAWAWNVRWLEHPNFFSFILNTDSKAANYNNLEPFKRVYTYYEFSQSDYWAYIGENVNVEIKRINPLPCESQVNLVLADGSKTSIEFATNLDTKTISLIPLETTSSIKLENTNLKNSNAIVKANIRPYPVYEFTQTTPFNGQIGQSINLIISRKGDLSQSSTVTVAFRKVIPNNSNNLFHTNQNQSPIPVTFNPNESQKPLPLPIPEDKTEVILQADNPKQIGTNSTAIIIPENVYEFVKTYFTGYVDEALALQIIRKGDTTQASTIYTRWQGFDGIVDTVKFNVGEKSKIINDWRIPDQDVILELYRPTSGRVGTQSQCQIDVKEYYYFGKQGYSGEYGDKVKVKILKVGNLHKATEFILQDEKTRKARLYTFPANKQKIAKEIKVDDEQGFTLHIKPSQWENPPIAKLVTSTYIAPLTHYWLSDDTYGGYCGKKVNVTVCRKYCLTKATIEIYDFYSGKDKPVDFHQGDKEKPVTFDVGQSDFNIQLREPEYGRLIEQDSNAQIQSHPIYKFSQKTYEGTIGQTVDITINRIGNLSRESEVLLLLNGKPYTEDGIQDGIVNFTYENSKTVKFNGNMQLTPIELRELSEKHYFDQASISIKKSKPSESTVADNKGTSEYSDFDDYIPANESEKNEKELTPEDLAKRNLLLNNIARVFVKAQKQDKKVRSFEAELDKLIEYLSEDDHNKDNWCQSIQQNKIDFADKEYHIECRALLVLLTIEHKENLKTWLNSIGEENIQTVNLQTKLINRAKELQQKYKNVYNYFSQRIGKQIQNIFVELLENYPSDHKLNEFYSRVEWLLINSGINPWTVESHLYCRRFDQTIHNYQQNNQNDQDVFIEKLIQLSNQYNLPIENVLPLYHLIKSLFDKAESNQLNKSQWTAIRDRIKSFLKEKLSPIKSRFIPSRENNGQQETENNTRSYIKPVKNFIISNCIPIFVVLLVVSALAVVFISQSKQSSKDDNQENAPEKFKTKIEQYLNNNSDHVVIISLRKPFSGKKNMITQDTSDRAEDIQIIQEVLNIVLNLQKEKKLEITGKFDQETVNAVKQFQKSQGSKKPLASVDGDTWEKMQQSFKDKQIEVVTGFLLYSFEKNQEEQIEEQIEEHIKKQLKQIENCQPEEGMSFDQKRQKAIGYIECVESINSEDKENN